jgi:hypothetical protein
LLQQTAAAILVPRDITAQRAVAAAEHVVRPQRVMALEDHDLDGLWSYATYEEGGSKRAADQVAAMAKLVFIEGEHLPGWDGLWGAVAYGHQGGTWTEAAVRAACRRVIIGGEPEGEAQPADFYLWAGGRFRAASNRLPKEIDFEQYYRGEAMPPMNLGIYAMNEGRLILCLAEAGKPRPSGFNSREQAHQSLGELVRGRTAK